MGQVVLACLFEFLGVVIVVVVAMSLALFEGESLLDPVQAILDAIIHLHYSIQYSPGPELQIDQ